MSQPDEEWETRVDPETRCVFFLNHRTKTTTWVPPPHLLPPPTHQPPVDLAVQNAMIALYLEKVQDTRKTKEVVLTLKKERVGLAERELQSLETENGLMHKVGSSIADRFDPELLRAEIEVAKRRVEDLKREERDLRLDLADRAKAAEGLSALAHRDEEDEVALNEELLRVGQALSSGREERHKLLRELSGYRGEEEEIPSPQPLSPTPVSSVSPSSTSPSLAEIAATRRQFEQLQGQLSLLQDRRLAMEAQLDSAQLAEDKEQLALLHEKEQLLRELKTVALTQTQSSPETHHLVNQKIAALEEDLRSCLAQGQPEMEARLDANKRYTQLRREIRSLAERLAVLELQLRSFSVSSLSSSSSTHSSACSLEATNASLGSLGELRARVEQLLAAGNRPEVDEEPRRGQLSRRESGGPSSSSHSAVSNAVSDESMAGDSGVFEASGEEDSPDAVQLALSITFEHAEGGAFSLSLHHARHLRRLPGVGPGALISVQGLLLPTNHDLPHFASAWAPFSDRPVWKQEFRIPISLASLRSKVLQLHLISQQGNLQEVVGSAQVNFGTFDDGLIRFFWVNILSVHQQATLRRPYRRTPSPNGRPPPETREQHSQSPRHSRPLSRRPDRPRQTYSPAAEYLPAAEYPERAGRREGSSDESTIVSSQTSTLTRDAAPPTAHHSSSSSADSSHSQLGPKFTSRVSLPGSEAPGVTSILVGDPRAETRPARFQDALGVGVEVQAAKLKLWRQEAELERLRELKAGLEVRRTAQEPSTPVPSTPVPIPAQSKPSSSRVQRLRAKYEAPPAALTHSHSRFKKQMESFISPGVTKITVNDLEASSSSPRHE